MSLYLVTGGAGFIGSHIAQALIARGDRVRVLDDLSSGKTANLAPHEVGEAGSSAPVEFVQGEVADAAAVERACEGVYGVFHEAAQVSVPRSIEDPEASVREAAVVSLRSLTDQDFRFNPGGKESDRAKRIKAWREWWSREADDLLGR